MMTKKQIIANVTVIVAALGIGGGVLWATADNNGPTLSADTCTTTPYYLDSDNDSYGNPGNVINACEKPSGYIDNNTDCNDGNTSIHPGASETCDSIDNDCDGNVDEGLATTTYYLDTDGDNYGIASDTKTACAKPSGYAAANNDCNDSNAAINPGATEICDGVDNNCNNTQDEGCGAPTYKYYRDADSDSYGNPSDYTWAATKPSGYVDNNTDCNDSNSSIHPGATEVCDGVDNDCDGQIDESVKTTYYYDFDNDNYGLSASSTAACSKPSGYAAANSDCNDNNNSIHPNAAEVCDSVDNDCDGTIDESCGQLTWYYRDYDGDGYGTATTSVQTSTKPDGYVANNSDCNDNKKAVNPGATEVCDNIDNDCDGQIDEGLNCGSTGCGDCTCKCKCACTCQTACGCNTGDDDDEVIVSPCQAENIKNFGSCASFMAHWKNLQKMTEKIKMDAKQTTITINAKFKAEKEKMEAKKNKNKKGKND